MSKKTIKNKKSIDQKTDLEGDVILNKRELQDEKKISKKHKFMNIFFPVLGVTALAIGGGVLGYGIVKSQQSTKDSEITKEHTITITQPETTTGWSILSDKVSAKKGDVVVFSVKASNLNTTKVPSQIKINNSYFDLIKQEDGSYKTTVTIDFVENMNVSLIMKEINVKSIKITNYPTKVNYNDGDTLDTSGLKVSKVMDDGTTVELSTSDYTCTPTSGTSLSTSNKTVTIKATIDSKEYTTSYPIAVSEASKKNFSTISWSDLSDLINQVEDGTLTETEFCAKFGSFIVERPTGVEEITPESFEDFVGCVRYVKVNNLNHAVRVCGVNHDTLTTAIGTRTKALFTFEFKNVICDENGSYLSSKWDTEYNYNYLNSIVRANLTGEGEGTQSLDNTVLELLPTELTKDGVIKSVTKEVRINENQSGTGYTNYTKKNYDTNLFIQTPREIGWYDDSSETGGDEGTTYELYEKCTDQTSGFRVRTPLDGSGSYCWLASPYCGNTSSSWYVDADGYVHRNSVSNDRALAPCFCI